jgi:diguanylate cyclase (GGDEF)-like protein
MQVFQPPSTRHWIKWFQALITALIGFLGLTWSSGTLALTPEFTQNLNDPIAYCLSTLNECAPDKQIPFEGKVPSDLRAVNGGTQDPVTLVYQLPERESNGDYAVMMAPYYTNHCFRFDVAAPTVCTERELTQITLPAGAEQLLSQAVQLPHLRIFPPNMVWGTTKALHAQSTSERDTIKMLTGWYAFICLATLFQLMTQRNQQLSVSLALMMATVILRINTSAKGGFSGTVFINPEISRIVEYLTLPLLSLFIVHYYAQLVGNYLLRTRLAFYAFCIVAAAIIVLATQPAHILLSLQIAQVVVLIGILLGLVCVFKALRTLDRRQSSILILGFSAIILGFIIDLYLTTQGKPLIGGTGLGPYGLAIEAMCQYMLIALRNDAAHHEARRYQKKQLATQALLVKSLEASENELFKKVMERTAELQATNTQLVQAVKTADAEHEKTGKALSELEITMQQLKLANDQLERMAMTDGLTKVNNRAFFDKTFHEEYRRSQRMKIPLSLIILDIDFFKKINDTYGHPGGDACLRAMGSLIQSRITRAGDIVARFGGEEFVILLPDCDEQNAVKFAEALREQVQQMQVQFDEVTICFTASFGVACGSPASSFNTETMLLSQADTALYQAKDDGRNCVRTFADTQ